MKGDIFLIGYTTELSKYIVSELSAEKSVLIYSPRTVIMQDGQRIIPATWYGRESNPNLLIDGYRLDQVIIADDSRMNILKKVFPFVPQLYAACSRSEIPFEFQISILNTDTWNSEFIEKWFGYKFSFRPGTYIY